MRAKLAAEIKRTGGQRAFGELHGVTGQHVGRVVNGEKLSPSLLEALGFEVAGTVTTYRRLKR